MAIYRGAGGAGDAVGDASSEVLLALAAKDAAIAAQVAAEAAQAAAQTAETNAELAETNAETAETNAETAETNAETAATNAASSASAASTSATNAAASASTATTQATNAASSASAASTSASNASTSATNSANSASSASTSATNAANSATAAQTAQTAAEAAFDAFDDIYLGAKSSNPTVDNDGNALTTGDQYFNTVANELRIWNGSSWQAASTVGGTVSSLTVTGAFAANGSTTIGDASGDSVTINASTITTPNGLTVNGTVIPASKTLVVTTDIGSTVQAYDAQLADVASLTPTDNNFIVGNGTNFVAESGSTARTSLGLGSIATQDASNVTVTGGTINGATIGATTATTGKFTTLEATGVATFSAGAVGTPAITTTGDTNTGIFFPAADTIAFTEGGVESMRIDSSGNLGLGITPQTWYLNSSVYGAFQFGAGALFYGRTTSSAVNLELSTNSYLDASAAYRYLFTGEASRYAQASGAHIWSSAASGTAGNSFSYSERMRIDSSGNVGIGTSSPNGKVDIVSSSAGANTDTLFLTNSSGTAGTATSLVFGVGSDPTNRQAVIRGINAGSNAINLAFLTSNADVPAERMRIDSSGNVGIGTTSPATKFHVSGQTRIADSSNSANYMTLGVGANAPYGNASLSTTTAGLSIVAEGAGNMTFSNNGSERMRITSGGALCVGTTSATGAVRFIVESDTTTLNPMTVSNTRSTAATDYSILFYRNGSIVGSVQTSLSATSYVTSSDYRLKENIAPMTGALNKVAQLKPITYNWKSDGSDGQGFIAHELQEFAPYAVSGVKDGEQMQGVDYGKITPLLTAALQEALAKIESLEARLAVLESK